VKYIRLRAVADIAMDVVVGPSTPCKKGCAACCRIALPITVSEARILSRASGKRMRWWVRLLSPREAQAKMVENTAKYKGVACPFLVNEECSVYEARPIQCRTHHVLEADASRCDPHADAEVGKYDMLWIEDAAAALMGEERFADIREFFK